MGLAGGQLYILQSRPITQGADRFFTTIASAEATQFWTAGFLNERFPLPVSPLGWTVINELLERLAFRDPLRYLGLAGCRPAAHHPAVPRPSLRQPLCVSDALQGFPQLAVARGRLPLLSIRKNRSCAARSATRAPSLIPASSSPWLWHFLHQPALWSPWHNYRVWAAFTVQHDRRSQETGGRIRGSACDGLHRSGRSGPPSRRRRN